MMSTRPVSTQKHCAPAVIAIPFDAMYMTLPLFEQQMITIVASIWRQAQRFVSGVSSLPARKGNSRAS